MAAREALWAAADRARSEAEESARRYRDSHSATEEERNALLQATKAAERRATEMQLEAERQEHEALRLNEVFWSVYSRGSAKQQGMKICLDVCMYCVCVRVCVDIYVCIVCICMYVCVRVCIDIYLYIYMCVDMCACVCVLDCREVDIK